MCLHATRKCYVNRSTTIATKTPIRITTITEITIILRQTFSIKLFIFLLIFALVIYRGRSLC